MNLRDTPINSLSSAAASGGRWGLVRSLLLQVFTVTSTVVLARILIPSDFGLVAGAAVIVGLFELLTSFGFGASLIRRQQLREGEISTIFWLTAGLGVVAGTLAFTGSGLLARLMGEPNVAPLVAALSFTIPVRLVGGIGSALLTRGLRFRAVSLTEISAASLYLGVATAFALAGFGPWAIVIAQILRALAASITFLILSEWRPRLQFEKRYVRDELAFSSGLLSHSWLDYVQNNLDYWVVSATLGASALGSYYVAYVVTDLVRKRITSVAQSVLFPVLSKFGQDERRIREASLKVMGVVTFVSIPSLLGLAVLAEPVVRVAFGPGWEEAVGPLAVLATAGAVTALAIHCSPIALSVGRPYLLLPSKGAGIVALASSLAITAQFRDLATLSLSILIAAVVTNFLFLRVIGKVVGLSPLQYLIKLGPVFLVSGFMTVTILILDRFVIRGLHPIVSLALCIPVGAGVYAGLFWLLFRDRFRIYSGAVRVLVTGGRR